MRLCAVEVCTPGEIPPGIVNKESTIISSIPELCAGDDQTKQELSFVNSTLSAKTLADFRLWKSHDLNLYSYCDIDDEESTRFGGLFTKKIASNRTRPISLQLT